MEERLNCVILAAGMGTRMRSAVPKVAHPIMGRPMVRYVTDTALCAPADEDRRRYRALPAMFVEACLADTGISFARQTDQLGTAHASSIRGAATRPRRHPGLYGDVPLIQAATLSAFVEFFRFSEGICFMTTKVDNPSGYGRVIVGDRDTITGISWRTARRKATCADRCYQHGDLHDKAGSPFPREGSERPTNKKKSIS